MHNATKPFVIILAFFTIIFSFTTNAKTDSQFDDLIRTTSEKFLGRPYHLNPLGEGQGASVDTDPLYRTDVFDCLTYVETVLANVIALKKYDTTQQISDEKIIPILNAIRYRDGIVSFENRNHFQHPDWTSGNNKILTNTTKDLSTFIGTNTATSTVNICRQQWFKKSHNISIQKDDEVFANCEKVSIDYIPLSNIEKHMPEFKKIQQSPLIFMTVTSDETLMEKIGTEYNISHTGFLIPSNGNLYLRHASSIAKKVIDSDFSNYIKKLQKNKKYLGFAFLKFNNI